MRTQNLFTDRPDGCGTRTTVVPARENVAKVVAAKISMFGSGDKA